MERLSAAIIAQSKSKTEINLLEEAPGTKVLPERRNSSSIGQIKTACTDIAVPVFIPETNRRKNWRGIIGGRR